MKWPVPQDFNEAVQTPALAFADPVLKAGQPVVGAQGMPLPRSGNFADVYQIKAADGRDWALKCFTRPVVGMDGRYRAIGEHLSRAALPFTVGFEYLPEGVRVAGKWYPAVKMEWVEGLLLNQFVRENAGRPAVLDALFGMWVKLSRRLREAGVAHADLQHGNVLLVPGSKAGALGLKLIDYDGMYLPALANSPAGELGHANYQHPARAAKQIYSQDLDRFPHLVVATALKALARFGAPLWERYDTGENLLFTEPDFQAPEKSRLMKELWTVGDPALRALVGRLAVACKRPLPQTPWFDAVAPEGVVKPLSTDEAADAAAIFDAAPAVAAVVPIGDGWDAPAPVPTGTRATPAGTRLGTRTAPMGTRIAPAVEDEDPNAFAPPESPDDFAAVADSPTPRRRPAQSGGSMLPIALIVGLLAVAGVGGAFALGVFKKKPPEVAQKADDDPQDVKPPRKAEPPAASGEKEPPARVETPTPAPKEDPEDPPGPPSAATNLPVLPVRWGVDVGDKTPSLVGLAFSRDGSRVALAQNSQNSVPVFDPKTGSAAGLFIGHEDKVVGVAALPDGNMVSLAVNEPHALVWDPVTFKSVGKIPVDNPFNAPAGLFRVSPNGKFIALAKYAKPYPPAGGKGKPAEPFEPTTITVTDVDRGQKAATTPFTGGVVRFSADSTRLLIADDQGRFRSITLLTNKWVNQDVAGPTARRALAISPDGSKVLYQCKVEESGKDEIRLFDTATGKPGASLATTSTPPGSGVDFSPDGRWVYVRLSGGGGSGKAASFALVDTVTGKQTVEFPLRQSGSSASSAQIGYFSPDGKQVVFLRQGTGLQAFDIPGTAVAVTPAPPGVKPPTPPPIEPPPVAAGRAKPRWSVAPTDEGGFTQAFSPDGQTLYAAARDVGRVRAYESLSGKEVSSFSAPGKGFSVFATAAGAAFAPPGQPFSIWNPKTGGTTPIVVPPLPEGDGSKELSQTLSPDGRFAFVGRMTPADPSGTKGDGAPFEVFAIATGKVVASGEWVNGFARFTPDGSRLIVMDKTKSGSWYRLPGGEADGKFVVRAAAGTYNITLVSLSNGGKTGLLHLSGSGTLEPALYLWDAGTGRIGRRVCKTPGPAILSADGRVVVATLSGDDLPTPRSPGRVVAQDAETGRILLTVELPADLRGQLHLDLSADGRRLAVALPRGDLSVYDIVPGDGGVAVAPTPSDPGPPKVDMTTVPPPVPGTGRVAVPSAEAVAAAEAKVRTVFKAEYARKLVPDRKALALKLLTTADGTTDDPASQYIMYRDAREIAVECGDPVLVGQAADGVGKHFEVNGEELKAAAFEKLTAAFGSATVLRAVADQAVTGADGAADADDYAIALRLAQVAAVAVKKGNLPGGEDADARVTYLKKSRETFEAVKAQLEVLKANPADPAASLAVGKYRCFVQGKWDDGVKLLATGGDAALKELAAMEVSAATNGAVGTEQKLPDGWWDYAQTAADAEKRAAEGRARYWYTKLLPGLAGLNKLRAEGRLGFTFNGTEYKPGLLAEFSSTRFTVPKAKRARIDAAVDFTAADFADPARRADLTAKWTGVINPPRPGRYRLVAVADDPVRIKVDGRVVVDPAVKGPKKTATLTLFDRPAAIQVEFLGQNTAKHKIKLMWSPPGSTAEELVPAEFLFHDKKAESALGK